MQTAPLTVDTMTVDTMPPPAAAPMPRRAMRVFLAFVALCQAAGTLSIWPIFFNDLSALPGQGGWITAAVIAISPLAAIAALAFALTGRLRFSIMAIAALSLLDWSRSLPKIVSNGLDFLFVMPSIYDFLQFYVFPALCIAAIVLAALNVRLGAASLMATTPSVLHGLFWVAFAIVVSIYGF
jgi:hypothetical protein